MVDNYQDGNYHVYEAHTGLIKCFYMDASHNKIWDNMTSMVRCMRRRRRFPPPHARLTPRYGSGGRTCRATSGRPRGRRAARRSIS